MLFPAIRYCVFYIVVLKIKVKYEYFMELQITKAETHIQIH